jgi:hypothetical protein
LPDTGKDGGFLVARAFSLPAEGWP